MTFLFLYCCWLQLCSVHYSFKCFPYFFFILSYNNSMSALNNDHIITLSSNCTRAFNPVLCQECHSISTTHHCMFYVTIGGCFLQHSCSGEVDNNIGQFCGAPFCGICMECIEELKTEHYVACTVVSNMKRDRWAHLPL